jgi:uncharacterized integral membrane protein
MAQPSLLFVWIFALFALHNTEETPVQFVAIVQQKKKNFAL